MLANIDISNDETKPIEGFLIDSNIKQIFNGTRDHIYSSTSPQPYSKSIDGIRPVDSDVNFHRLTSLVRNAKYPTTTNY